ncbi:glucose 1-dehydrogenase [Yoonia vestfoldensis]|uniref:Glucose 1-dehydrogenase 4 n=1 Tax=Yoonia vestfoldensis TaxID=245188 RepID=A0A1Y0EBF6_9RHOB|nr:glucose 1-dehydrogenase [Yoonia vestfoldensis]ARU00692.1 glucose 1-dehydrogenase 4 [Yoonia vestfoldensis]
MQRLQLENTRAIVTGASSGIGAAIARGFGAEGAKVIVNYHKDAAAAQRIVAQIKDQGGLAQAVQADIASAQGCAALFAAAEQHFGGVDVLVANAGIQRDAPLTELRLDAWQKVIDVNLTGHFLCAQEAVRRFRRQTHDPESAVARGKIIFTSSVHQVIPWAGRVNYAAAKGGMKMMMESMAQELACEKIRVNAIAPGAIKTAINRDAWDDPANKKELLKLIPYGRIGLPEDIAKATLWLASDLSDCVVGTTLFVDGGMTLYPSFRDSG